MMPKTVNLPYRVPLEGAAPQTGAMTEREILAAARSVRELRALRDIQQQIGTTGKGRIGMSNMGYEAIPLETDEFQAVIALLIERHATMIASLGITPDVVPA